VGPSAPETRRPACSLPGMDIDVPFAHDPILVSDERRRAAVALAVALAAGALTQALFWRTGLGLNFWVWDLALVGASVAVFRRVTLGLLFGAPTAGFFTLLLSSDADFTRALVHAKDEAGEAVLFVTWSAITSAGYLVTHALHASAREARAIFHPHAACDGPYR